MEIVARNATYATLYSMYERNAGRKVQMEREDKSCSMYDNPCFDISYMKIYKFFHPRDNLVRQMSVHSLWLNHRNIVWENSTLISLTNRTASSYGLISCLSAVQVSICAFWFPRIVGLGRLLWRNSGIETSGDGSCFAAAAASSYQVLHSIRSGTDVGEGESYG